MNLNRDAALWRSPTVQSENSMRGSGQDPEKRIVQGHTVNLTDQASYWPTPAVRDHKGDNSNYTHIPAWPPGPTQYDEWQEIIQRWPELAPAVASTERINDDARGSASGDVCRERSEQAEVLGSTMADCDKRGFEVIGGEELLDGERSAFRDDADRCGESDRQETTQSTVCLLADGPSSELAVPPRVDQLRGLGNGVTPETAATAFAVLASRLGIGRITEDGRLELK